MTQAALWEDDRPAETAPVVVPRPLGFTGQVLAIVGSRHYPHLEHVRAYVRRLAAHYGDERAERLMVISGGAVGVDTVAVCIARHEGVSCYEVNARWRNPDGSVDRRAGFSRNGIVVAECDRLVAFWDGQSRGTLDTIRKARAAGKLHAVYGSGGRRMEVDG